MCWRGAPISTVFGLAQLCVVFALSGRTTAPEASSSLSVALIAVLALPTVALRPEQQEQYSVDHAVLNDVNGSVGSTLTSSLIESGDPADAMFAAFAADSVGKIADRHRTVDTRDGRVAASSVGSTDAAAKTDAQVAQRHTNEKSSSLQQQLEEHKVLDSLPASSFQKATQRFTTILSSGLELLSVGALCEHDQQDQRGLRTGCKRGCRCAAWEHCYTKMSDQDSQQDDGVCQMSLGMMAAIGAGFTLFLLLCTVLCRSVLQHRDFHIEHLQNNSIRQENVDSLINDGTKLVNSYEERRRSLQQSRSRRSEAWCSDSSRHMSLSGPGPSFSGS